MAFGLNETAPYRILIGNRFDSTDTDEVHTSDTDVTVLSQWPEPDRIVFTKRPTDFDASADVFQIERSEGERWLESPVFADTPNFHRSFGQISPDRNWIAYVSNRTNTGNGDIWISPFPSPSERDARKISEGDRTGARAQQPRWLSDTELIYLEGTGARLAIRIATLSFSNGAPTASGIRTLTRERINLVVPEFGSYFYDIRRNDQAPDELVVNFVDSDEDPLLHVLLNWREVVTTSR